MGASNQNTSNASRQEFMVLRPAQEPSEIRAAVMSFNAGASTAMTRARSILRRTSYWVYNPEVRKFGPGKFVGYAGMDFEMYERAYAGSVGGAKFDGHVTKEALEKALKTTFQSDSTLSDRLLQWGTELFGAGAFEGVDTSKWRFVTLPTERGYWAIMVNPDIYRVEDAVAERDSDLWTVNRSRVRAGDRVAIWKAKGSGKYRGVLALGEVLTDPSSLDEDPHALQYWYDSTQAGIQRRVRVRYVRPPNAPLWLEEDTSGALATLSVARATGGGVYRIKPEQWSNLLQALGGWPEGELEDAAAEAAWAARVRARGQGFAVSPAVRKAVEEYAMQRAEEHFGQDYEVTRRGKPYDLHCIHRETGQILYVEVKGTTTAGEEILLTPNEVRFAREHANRMTLFVQSGIITEESDAGQVVASSGVTRIWHPWDVDAGVLKPVGYVYAVPASTNQKG